MTRWTTSLVGVCLVAVGCGGPSGTAASNTPAPQVSASVSSPEPTAAPASNEFALGQAAKLASDGVTQVEITALAYKQPVATSGPQPADAGSPAGYVWAAADVKVCLLHEQSTVSQFAWALEYASGARVEPSSTGYDNFPRPGYPFGDTVVRAGRCLRGWITFPVSRSQRPSRLTYTIDSEDPPMVIEWSLPPR